jgi:uncharacterized protein (DUF697 family)
MAAATESVSSQKAAPAHPKVTVEAANESDEIRRSERLRLAEKIVRKNVYWALGIGVIPFPFVDFVGLTAVELKMIKELADTYEVKFSEGTAKSSITALAASIGSLGIAEVVTVSLFKLIPAVGQVVGAVSVSAVAAAFTQALGNVFIAHFEKGGTLLDFNAANMREYFRKEFTAAKSSVAELKKKQAQEASKPA